MFFVAIDLLTAVILLSTMYIAWRDRRNLHSVKFIVPAVALLAVGRLCDVMLEHPSLRQLNLFGLSSGAYEVIFAAIGNVADVTGVSFLVLNFLAVIRNERASTKLIEQLETLLPICSYCKKYRTTKNEWFPIEKFLKDHGGQKLTHGICPDCLAKIRSDYVRKKSG